MSASSTRLLVLGVVVIFGPANGYQLRRELLSWEVDRWAHLHPGSIYSMLGSLEKSGAIERFDLASDDGRTVAVYRPTASGLDEFLAGVEAAIADPPESGDLLPLRVAINFLTLLPRSVAVAALDRRIRRLWGALDAFDVRIDGFGDPPQVPPIVVRELALERDLVRAQLDWLHAVSAEVREGGFHFADDPGPDATWAPPADDPGHGMQEESVRYRRLIADRERRRSETA